MEIKKQGEFGFGLGETMIQCDVMMIVLPYPHKKCSSSRDDTQEACTADDVRHAYLRGV